MRWQTGIAFSKDQDGGDHDKKPSTTAQLRHDIDTGKTRDKVDHADPAAAPLGTDDEAGGQPPKPAAIDEARQQEDRRDK